ncbi:SulP family inorganic anion transporter [Herminiimonas fonticola]|uniref:SulP family sulfate permease n=1 Tax=Herminiimonas fonticola TaxID=303380 RepID=A0A4R6G7W4_9BURK|nr:sulfate permease [Herminiimonas fonticola]RBA23884.1 sulP: sulfate permease [Herminiimonas fonticola]TDN89884.1 SulP family sulfate permease [Herminiimonas fonticola]
MKFQFSFHPRLFDSLRDYDAGLFFRDLSAGLTVGIVALPLAMAFAIASGVKPEAGIFTAIIAGFLISAFGGSRVQIGGPAGAFIVIIYGIVETYGVANLLIATIFAGMMLCAMGLFRLGSLIRYIPVPIVIGFTNGIAVLIALSQMKDFFGLRIDKMPADFFAQLQVLTTHIDTFNPISVAIAILSLILIFAWPLIWKKKVDLPEWQASQKSNRLSAIMRAIPGTILVLILATLAVTLFDLKVDTIGSKFGGIPQDIPSFQLPQFSWELVKQLFPPALTIALLGAIESLLCARVADNITGDRHDPNQELMAQGLANVVTPFFGGIPATGTIARTVTNIRAGAATPIAGILHALTLLIIVLIAAPLANNIPLAALAAILLYVAYNMGEWHEFARLRHFSMNYRILMLATFLLTVIVDLTVAVQVGLVLACVFFIYRISSLTRIELIPSDSLHVPLPRGVMAYSIFGSLFFGAVGKLEGLIAPKEMPEKALILELHQLINMDATGLDALETIHKALQQQGSQLILCGPNQQPLDLMRRSGFLNRLGLQNCLRTLPEAVMRSEILAS